MRWARSDASASATVSLARSLAKLGSWNGCAIQPWRSPRDRRRLLARPSARDPSSRTVAESGSEGLAGVLDFEVRLITTTTRKHSTTSDSTKISSAFTWDTPLGQAQPVRRHTTGDAAQNDLRRDVRGGVKECWLAEPDHAPRQERRVSRHELAKRA